MFLYLGLVNDGQLMPFKERAMVIAYDLIFVVVNCLVPFFRTSYLERDLALTGLRNDLDILDMNSKISSDKSKSGLYHLPNILDMISRIFP